MARQSAAARKRRTRTKRAPRDADEPDTAAAVPIESTAEIVAAAAPIAAAEEPPPAAESVAAAQERFVPVERPLTLVQPPRVAEAEPAGAAGEPIISADEPAMPTPARIRTPAECKARLDRITLQWCDLAERRLQHYTELYRSGRWRRYYTEERFVVVMNEVAKTVANWRALADRIAPAAAGNDDLRLSA